MKNFTIQIELPNTDALAILSGGKAELTKWLEKYGNPILKYDSEFKVYRVPAFAESRRQYSEAKQRDCDRWGCE